MPSTTHWVQWSLAAGVALGLPGFLLWCAADPSTDLDAPRGGWAFVRHVVHWGLFHGEEAGHPSCRIPATLPVALLEPGDIIIARNPHAVYGHWSHATLYLGSGRVLQQNIIGGISTAPVDWLDWYDELAVLRPAARPDLRQAAATWAAQLDGGLFNLLANRADPGQWTCASSVWAAYQRLGVEVGDDRTWITPDALAAAREPDLRPPWQRLMNDSSPPGDRYVRSILHLIRIALALVGLQALAIALAWWASPVRLLAWLLLLAVVAGTVWVARDAAWLAGLHHRRRVLAIALWQLPGLAGSILTIALLLGWQGPQVLIVLLQLWELPAGPLLASMPTRHLGITPVALWLCTLLPWLHAGLAVAVTWPVRSPTGAAMNAPSSSPPHPAA